MNRKQEIKNLSVSGLSLRNLPHLLLALVGKAFSLLLLQHKLLKRKNKCEGKEQLPAVGSSHLTFRSSSEPLTPRVCGAGQGTQEDGTSWPSPGQVLGCQGGQVRSVGTWLSSSSCLCIWNCCCSSCCCAACWCRS